MVKEEKNGLVYFRFENLSKLPGIVNFVSTRIGGVSKPPYDSLNLSFVENNLEAVVENTRRLAKAVDVPLDNFVFCNQVHSNNVAIVNSKDKGAGVFDRESAIPDCDGMIAKESDICLTILAADCVPVLLYDPANKVIGAVHSGWRGTVKKVTTLAVGKMIQEYGTNPSDLVVGIGPSIGPDSYEVGQDVIQLVKEEFPDVELVKMKSTEKGMLDLWKAQVYQLTSLGVPEENIEVSGVDTFTNVDLFFSNRRQNPTGRFAAGMMLR